MTVRIIVILASALAILLLAGVLSLRLNYESWMRDPIRHEELPSIRETINITLDGHIFHEGSTVHRVYFDTGSLYYSVVGEGTGFGPRFNNTLGIILFRPGVARAVRDYGIWP